MAGGSNVLAAAAPEWPRTARRVAHACMTFALWTAVGVAIGLIAIVTLPGVFGYQALTVVSGSMEPTLDTGSVVIDEVISPVDARPGDVVTFQDPLRPRQLTHRLQKVRVEGDTFHMVTLGDANDAPERWTVPSGRPDWPRRGPPAEARLRALRARARPTRASARSERCWRSVPCCSWTCGGRGGPAR